MYRCSNPYNNAGLPGYNTLNCSMVSVLMFLRHTKTDILVKEPAEL